MIKYFALILLSLPLAPSARAGELDAFVRCGGKPGEWIGNVSADDRCFSGLSFTSPDIESICLSSSRNLSAGTYSIRGIHCFGDTIQVISARRVLSQ